MTTALTGVFLVKHAAEVRELPTGENVLTLRLSYPYGGKLSDGSRLTQWIDAGAWGTRAATLAPRLLANALVFCVIEHVHIESYTTSAGITGHKLVGRLGRCDVIQQHFDPETSPAFRP